MIENESEQSLIDKAAQLQSVDTERHVCAKVDVERLLKNMRNKRYEYVIRRLVLQDARPEDVAKELCTNVDNLYNIKKRAISSLSEIALNQTGKYGQKGDQ